MILIKLVNMALLFVNTVLLARILGAENFGAYSFSISLIHFLSIPVVFGLPNLVTREIAAGVTRGAWGKVKGVIRWGYRYILVFSGFLILILWLTGTWQASLMGDLRGSTFSASWPLIPLGALLLFQGAVLKGFKHVLLGQIPEMLIRPGIFTLILCCLLIPLHARSCSASEAMLLFIASSALALLVSWLMMVIRPGLDREVNSTEIHSREWFSSLLPLGLFAGLGMINGQTDILMLGLFRSDDQVGIYRISVQLAMLIVLGLNVLNAVIAPHIASLYAANRLEELEKLMKVCSKYLALVTIAMVAMLWGTGKSLISFFFKEEFVEAYYPFLILSGGQAVNALAGPVGQLLVMTGHERQAVRGVAIAAGTNVLLNFLLVPKLGIYGAALATSATLIIWNVILLLMVRQLLKIEPSWLLRGWKR